MGTLKKDEREIDEEFDEKQESKIVSKKKSAAAKQSANNPGCGYAEGDHFFERISPRRTSSGRASWTQNPLALLQKQKKH